PEASPKPRERTRSTLTRSPSLAPPASVGAIFNSRPASILSTGTNRPPPPGSLRKIPSTRACARSITWMTLPRQAAPPPVSRSAIRPSSANSRRIRFNSARSAFFRPNSRAISRVPTFPGCARMKATRASGVGKLLSRFLGTLSPGLARALLRRRFGCCCGFCRRRLGGGCDRRARLAGGFRFRFCGSLLRRRFLGGFRCVGIGAEAAAARPLGDLFSNQRHRAIEADVEHLIAGLQARIGLFVAHERAEAADAGGDRLAGLRMFSDFARQRQQI